MTNVSGIQVDRLDARLEMREHGASLTRFDLLHAERRNQLPSTLLSHTRQLEGHSFSGAADNKLTPGSHLELGRSKTSQRPNHSRLLDNFYFLYLRAIMYPRIWRNKMQSPKYGPVSDEEKASVDESSESSDNLLHTASINKSVSKNTLGIVPVISVLLNIALVLLGISYSVSHSQAKQPVQLPLADESLLENGLEQTPLLSSTVMVPESTCTTGNMTIASSLLNICPVPKRMTMWSEDQRFMDPTRRGNHAWDEMMPSEYAAILPARQPG
jgi:hypothetical protein